MPWRYIMVWVRYIGLFITLHILYIAVYFYSIGLFVYFPPLIFLPIIHIISIPFIGEWILQDYSPQNIFYTSYIISILAIAPTSGDFSAYFNYPYRIFELLGDSFYGGDNGIATSYILPIIVITVLMIIMAIRFIWDNNS